MTRAIDAIKLRRCLRRFAGDRKGVSAVEFALLLPFIIFLFVCSVELGTASSVQFKTALAARTIADLASQYTTIDSSTMSQILGAGPTVLTPYAAANATVIVSEVEVAQNATTGTIRWSTDTAAHPQNQSVPLPAAFQSPPSNIWLIWGEVTDPYTPPIGDLLTGAFNIYVDAFFYPRQSTCVSYNNVCS